MHILCNSPFELCHFTLACFFFFFAGTKSNIYNNIA
uniref:Uncharacterized protein n=1 Tax=Anguilla anguilla TaxID=7936 RepID=A0A0E9R0S4_ANGAN